MRVIIGHDLPGVITFRKRSRSSLPLTALLQMRLALSYEANRTERCTLALAWRRGSALRVPLQHIAETIRAALAARADVSPA